MRRFAMFAAAVLVALLGWVVVSRLNSGVAQVETQSSAAAPVSVADVIVGPVELRRVYSGTLEARAEFVVASKIGGRIKSIAVDMSDRVKRGQVVAELDDAEYRQAVVQAEAELEVAQATHLDATRALEIATRDFERLESLRDQQIASESQTDRARAEMLSSQGAVAIAGAEVRRAEALLEAAKIRLGYTTVEASWTGPGDVRVVAARYEDEGATLSANTPLMSIVSLDPIVGIVYVTEKDYANLQANLAVQIRTDAYSDRPFTGHVSRIAPVFRQNSRQARVEMTIDNPENSLKPGMFIRAEVVLEQIAKATTVPVDALVTRDGEQGVFVLAADAGSVRWTTVRPGIVDGDRVQVFGEGVTGRVVTLGQQLIGDGSPVVVPADRAPETSR